MAKVQRNHQNYDNDHHHTTPIVDSIDDDNNRAECGLGSFKPAALRMCATIPMFVGVYSINGLMTSTLSSYVNSQVTTLERHFGFNSSQTGLIMAANDVGFLVVVLFISYIAAKVHIPRALGFVTVLFGISGITCALPHFLFGAPSPASSADVGSSNGSRMTSAKPSASFTGQICDGINETSFECGVSMADTIKMADNEQASNPARANASAALAIIVVGMILQGIAKTPRSSFTLTYVDANVERVKTGFLMGIITTVAIMGPALAFSLGGLFTRIYVTLEGTDMHYRHPRWIGAWWLGYITFGVAACVFAFPLFFFPRRIKGGKQEKCPATTRTHRVSAPRMVSTFLGGFLSAMGRLITNPVYLCSVLSTCALLFSVAGSQSFTPKYIENQFSFPAWKANMAMAGMMLGTACVGTFVGGYLTKRFKMGPMVSLKFVVVSQLVSCTMTGISILFKCDQPYIYNSPGPRASEDTSIEGCMDSCGCDDDDYFPVCGGDGRTFFSPCHAGCLHTVDGSYVNCTCITDGTAVAGMCDHSCSMFYAFFLSLCFSALFSTFSIIPKVIVYIRAVEERDKPLALGFSSFMTSITGWMLGPICFGKLIDGICIQWEHVCTKSGACRLYDNDEFRLKLLGYQSIFRVLGLVFIIIALISAKKTKKFEKTEANTEANGDAMLNLMTGQKDDEHQQQSSTDKDNSVSHPL